MFNLENYRHSVVPQIKAWRAIRTRESVKDAVSNIALSTGCPILAVCYFLAELEGENDELTNLIIRLEDFYDVKDGSKA